MKLRVRNIIEPIRRNQWNLFHISTRRQSNPLQNPEHYVERTMAKRQKRHRTHGLQRQTLGPRNPQRHRHLNPPSSTRTTAAGTNSLVLIKIRGERAFLPRRPFESSAKSPFGQRCAAQLKLNTVAISSCVQGPRNGWSWRAKFDWHVARCISILGRSAPFLSIARFRQL